MRGCFRRIPSVFAFSLVLGIGLIAWSSAATAQVCTTSGSTVTCTNSITIPTFLANNAIGDTVATNSGTVTGNFTANTAIGNTTATNGGTINGSATVNTAIGNSILTNYGWIGGGVTVNSAIGNSTLNNYGTIANGVVVNTAIGDSTLNNYAGSRIIGAININTAIGTANLNFFGGNYLYTLANLAGVTINTNGAPFVVAGNTVAVLDPTAFALADRTLMQFTGGVSQMLQGRFNGMPATPGGGMSAIGFAPTMPGIFDSAQAAFSGIPSAAMSYASEPRKMYGKAPAAAVVPYYDTVVWANGFGGVREQNSGGAVLKATSTAYGGAIGIDRQFLPDLRLGAFVGGGSGRLRTDFDVHNVDTTYVFGGGYGRFERGPFFVDFALFGGSADNRSTRTVANNNVANGLEIARANYGGWFISPDVTIGQRIAVADFVLTPRARVRYVAGFLDGYAETGSAQTLVVGGRTLQDIEERLEVELSKVFQVAWGGTVKATSSAGVIGLQRVGDTNVNTVLLGQNLAFVAPGRNDAVGGVVGAGLDYRPVANVGIFAAGEATWMNDNSWSAVGKGGVRVSF
jgi:uncharacterized protein with beta-barrel porin domain